MEISNEHSGPPDCAHIPEHDPTLPASEDEFPVGYRNFTIVTGAMCRDCYDAVELALTDIPVNYGTYIIEKVSTEDP